MVFSSLTFLFLFLPGMLLLYFVTPRKAKNAALFLGSLIFYAWGEPVYVVLMIFSTVLDYTCGRLIEKYRDTPKQKLGLVLSLAGNLGLLFFFKYADFLIGTINSITGAGIPKHGLPLPIGISFYTFQTMSYTIDVYRGQVKAQKNIISFGAYVSLFPQLIAGPIVRYREIAEELENRRHTTDSFGEGARRFVTGLSKKVLLANNIGLLWDTIAATDPAKLSTVCAWLGVVAFAFQIYFDFSGYSDMAIGLGKMFGFSFPENFNYPYIAANVTDFWRRWHMSLSAWFRDYVYIPLGGNRKGLRRQIINIAIVWILTGLWHGASWNFVLWGAWYGFLLILEKCFLLRVFKKTPAFVSHIFTGFAVLVGWTFFAITDIGQCFRYIGTMFGAGAGFIDDITLYYLSNYLPMLLLCAFFSTPLWKKLAAKVMSLVGLSKDTSTDGSLDGSSEEAAERASTGLLRRGAQAVFLAVDSCWFVVLSLLSLMYLVSSSYNPFLYFRF